MFNIILRYKAVIIYAAVISTAKAISISGSTLVFGRKSLIVKSTNPTVNNAGSAKISGRGAEKAEGMLKSNPAGRIIDVKAQIAVETVPKTRTLTG